MRDPVDTLQGDNEALRLDVDNLLKNETLNKLAETKQMGVTYGAMSEGEWQILGSAASALAGAGVKGEDGKIKYFDLSEDKFKEYIDIIKSKSSLALQEIEKEKQQEGTTQQGQSQQNESVLFNPK